MKLTDQAKWHVGDALVYFDTELFKNVKGTIVRLIDEDHAIVHWDDGYRDSGIRLSECERVA